MNTFDEGGDNTGKDCDFNWRKHDAYLKPQFKKLIHQRTIIFRLVFYLGFIFAPVTSTSIIVVVVVIFCLVGLVPSFLFVVSFLFILVLIPPTLALILYPIVRTVPGILIFLLWFGPVSLNRTDIILCWMLLDDPYLT